MSIKKCCDNCIYFIDGIGEQNCCKNKNATISTPRVFIPKEDVVRKDEKENIIKILEEKFNNLVCSDLLQDEAYAIKDIIDELKEE